MGNNRIPIWFWGLFLFFAMDDLWFIVSNPLLIILIITVSYFFFREYIIKLMASFLTDPPTWWTYLEMLLEQNAPEAAANYREKKMQFAEKHAEKKQPAVPIAEVKEEEGKKKKVN